MSQQGLAKSQDADQQQQQQSTAHNDDADDAAGVEAEAADLIVGSYRLISLRSRRAGCEVWAALHRPTEMDVVMEIFPKTGDDKNLVESIVHTINRSAELAHCKLLRLLEAIDAETAIVLVYESYSSQSLQQYILNCPLNGKEFQRIVRSLVKIVHKLHRNCFFHGTLTADSFVLTRQKKIKFKDAPSCHMFVKSDIEPSRFDAILSKASDVWSLGALIYRLILHQFDGTLRQLPGGAASSAVESVAEIVAELNPDLSDLLTRMTDQNPVARIGTADCLRHPYLTRGQLVDDADPRLARLKAGRSSGGGFIISRDVVRFLSAAVGAPEAALRAAVADNDLSGWNAAYWLVKQRLAAGRGFPPLGRQDEAADEAATSSRAAATEAAPPPPETASSLPQKSHAATTTTTKAGGRRYSRTLSRLRSRRLGLKSPEPSASTRPAGTAASGTATTATAASAGRQRQQLLLRCHHQQLGVSVDAATGAAAVVELPPISVAPLATHRGPLGPNVLERAQQKQQQQQQKQQQQQQQKQQQKLASTDRYLGFIRHQEAMAASAAAAAPASSPSPSSRGTSGIRVRVQLRGRPLAESEQPQQLLNLPPLQTQPQQQQPQLQPPGGHRQASVLTQWSPRQPPNSRTDVGRPDDEKPRSRRGGGEAEEGDGGDGDGRDQTGPVQLGTQYRWENAFVRWPQWQRSRVV